MANTIRSLPPDLQRIANRVDKASGIGNADGAVDAAEIDQAAAEAGARPADWVGISSGDFQELKAAVAMAPADRPKLSKLGPGGMYESSVYPPVNGIQREVIRFATATNPAGFSLSGRPVELPTAMGNAHLVGVRFDDGVSTGRFTASVGGEGLPSFDGQFRPGQAPLNGPVMLSGMGAVRSVELFHKVPSSSEAADYYPLNRTVRAGEDVNIPLSAFRQGVGIDEIESRWTASYSVPDPSGRKSDEGKPFYLDGVYAKLFLVDEAGQERLIDRTKFIDANEVDNSHDLGGPRGTLLRYRFFANNPSGEGHAITFQSVRINYRSTNVHGPPPVQVPIGKILSSGERFEIELPPELRDKKIGRVEVRWTDMLSGTWERPGYAYGTLLIDGKPASSSESVQSPETQAFNYLNGAKATTGKVGVLIERDRAQVDWIKIYFES